MTKNLMNNQYNIAIVDVDFTENLLIVKIEKVNNEFIKNNSLDKVIQEYYASENGIKSMELSQRVIKLYHNLLFE